MARNRYGRSIGKWIAGLLLGFVAYAGLQYGNLLADMDRAADLYSRGDIEGALAAYEGVEGQLRKYGLIRVIPTRDRQNLFLNEARLLYALNQFDDALERLSKDEEVPGAPPDGRFLLLRGNIGYRRARLNYEQSPKKEVRLLEEDLLGAEDILRESLRLNPNEWDAKYNFEYVNQLRRSLTSVPDGKTRLLQESEKPQIKQLPPESAG